MDRPRLVALRLDTRFSPILASLLLLLFRSITPSAGSSPAGWSFTPASISLAYSTHLSTAQTKGLVPAYSATASRGNIVSK